MIDTLHTKKEKLQKDYDTLKARNVVLTDEIIEVMRERDDLSANRPMDPEKRYGEFTQNVRMKAVEENEELNMIKEDLEKHKAILRSRDFRDEILKSYLDPMYWARLSHRQALQIVDQYRTLN